MKVEQLIVQYLYNNKKVSIQDIGIFTLSPDVIIPAESEKETSLPENAIHFEYNNKAGKDEGLIDFIVEHSRKIKPLATSDLESYTILSRQFLNIGKPMEIEGLGTLIKNQQGIYVFEQGQTINPKLENHTVRIKEKVQDEISFSTPPKEPTNVKGIVLVVLTLVLLSVAGAIYYFAVYNKNEEVQVDQSAIVPFSEDTATAVIDTAAIAKTDSLNKAVDTPVVNDGYTFKIVLKDYPGKAAADQAFEKLTKYGHTLIVSQKDSQTYKLSMPFTSPLSDTLRAKDSLRKFFGGKPYVDL
jgi:hypothetical protein